MAEPKESTREERPHHASVVIPVWNAAATLPIQLEALAAQVDAPGFEVVIADNGSTDGSRDVVGSFAGRLDIRIVDASVRRGPAFARNAGVAAASTDNILFCDADDRVSGGWVGAMSEALKDHQIATGPVLYVDSLAPGPRAPRTPSRIPTAPRKFLDQVPFAPTCNLAVTARVFQELGGFDPELRTGQDADFTIRAHWAGYPLGWEKAAVVFHARRGSLSEAARQFFRYGYYDAFLYRKLRGEHLTRPSARQILRAYLALLLTPYRLFTGRRWSWVVNASQRAGRLAGSVRFRVFCP